MTSFQRHTLRRLDWQHIWVTVADWLERLPCRAGSVVPSYGALHSAQRNEGNTSPAIISKRYRMLFGYILRTALMNAQSK